MRAYRCEVGYRTKRGGVVLGMTIMARSLADAMDRAQRKALKGCPARKFAYVRAEIVDV